MEKWNDYDSGFARRMMDRVRRESSNSSSIFLPSSFGKGGGKGWPGFRAHGGIRSKRRKRNGMINRRRNKSRTVGAEKRDENDK